MDLIKFGHDLELDRRAYELRREGRSVRLERIPMEILLLLLERRPALVTREEIVNRIWGEGVFLDTDNSINGAIRKIRQALGDDPEEPRFIRTITGKGYRFIATPIEESAAPPPASAPRPSAPPGAAPQAAERQRAAPGVSRLGRGWWVLLLSLLVAGVAVGVQSRRSLFPAAPASEDRQVLAVLPFDNLTGDAGQDFFSDGFTEEMITRLGSLQPERLAVIARTSSMHYKASRAPLDRLAKELGVQYVLEGSIRRDADHVRITAQLIQVKDQTHLWAHQFDREYADVLRIQEEIARAIADQIELTLGESRASLGPVPALSPGAYAAYEHYLRGRYFWNKRTSADFQRAVASFQQAIGANPDDARAYAGLADTYTLMGTYGYAPEAEVIPKARTAALKALEIDENLAGALTSLALVNEMYDMDPRTAEARFRRAIELEPNYATAHHWYAEFLCFQGRSDEALREIAVARRLDPHSLVIATDHGVILTYARQFDRAMEEFRAVLAVDPSFGRAIGGMIGSYIGKGQLAEAMSEADRWCQLDDGPWPWAAVAGIHTLRGEPEKAQEALRNLEEASRRLGVDPDGPRVPAYVGMGRKEEFFALMEKTCRNTPWRLLPIQFSPGYDAFRDDPRFQELIRCAHRTPSGS